MRVNSKAQEFEWDSANADKNKKHGVNDSECEEVFFDPRKVIFNDALHSANEKRFILLAKTKQGRLLFLAYTERGNKVRVISARDINKREVSLYEKAT